MMIPRIIHYCWFGGKPLPKSAVKCIESWKKFFPEYKIKEWNESNYDVRKIPYIAQAYNAKKFAFVSDYARFDILYNEGGIYFDTDVEVIKPFDSIIKQGAFAGIESAGALATGLGIASSAANDIFKEILDSYKKEKFINDDGALKLKTVVTRVSDIFREHGFTSENKIQQVAGITIYPVDYFCTISVADGKLRITNNTRSIHHYAQSWQPKWQKYGRKVVLVIGDEKLKNFLKNIKKYLFKNS